MNSWCSKIMHTLHTTLTMFNRAHYLYTCKESGLQLSPHLLFQPPENHNYRQATSTFPKRLASMIGWEKEDWVYMYIYKIIINHELDSSQVELCQRPLSHSIWGQPGTSWPPADKKLTATHPFMIASLWSHYIPVCCTPTNRCTRSII